MSALAIVFRRDGAPTMAGQLRAMLDAVRYRGPDKAAVRTFHGGVAFGFAQLVVTPEEADEEQPLVSPRTGCAIVADARLDNRRELLRALPGAARPEMSDARLILLGYETWGSDVPARLLGDFAFGIWDPRLQQLLVARDTSGQRSLFYRDDGVTFAIGSELHQLLQDPRVRVAPNDERIRDFLVPLNALRNYKEQHATFYQGIYNVPAGRTVLVTRDRVTSRAYWDIDPRTEIRYRDERQYAEHFRTLFFDAVETRLRSSGPVGSLLSGGLDSTSIVCAAEELYGSERATDRGFVTYSTVFDAPDRDERPFIELTRSKYGLDSRFVETSDSSGQLDVAPGCFAEGPHMNGDGRADPLMQAVAEDGVRVLLSGDVADAYVGGSRLVFDSLLRRGRLRSFWHHFSTFRRLGPRESWRHTLVESCFAPLLPLAWQRRLIAARLRRTLRDNWDELGPSWLGDRIRDDIRTRHLELCLDLERHRKFSSPAREEQYRMLYPPLVSRWPAGWSIEIRQPFADRRLHEFVLAVPPEQHFQPHPESDLFYAGSKRVLRAAMVGILPEAVRTRTVKTVFGGTYLDDIGRRWPHYEATFGPAASPRVAECGYIDQRHFWARLERLREGSMGGDFIFILHVLGLESWLRKFDQPRDWLVQVPCVQRTRAIPGSTSKVVAVSAS